MEIMQEVTKYSMENGNQAQKQHLNHALQM